MTQLGFKIDLSRCVGCRACAVACKAELNTPDGVAYRRVVDQTSGSFPEQKKIFVTMACFHCDEPACLKACPVNAISKDQNFGIVLIDQNLCIGCKYCRAACPYGAPKFNKMTKKMEKCTLCVHRTLNSDRTALTGLKPSCVQTCIGKALDFVENPENSGTPPGNFSDRSMTLPSVNFEWDYMTPW